MTRRMSCRRQPAATSRSMSGCSDGSPHREMLTCASCANPSIRSSSVSKRSTGIAPSSVRGSPAVAGYGQKEQDWGHAATTCTLKNAGSVRRIPGSASSIAVAASASATPLPSSVSTSRAFRSQSAVSDARRRRWSLGSELGLDVERVDVLLDDREQRVPAGRGAGEAGHALGQGLQPGHRFDAEDLGREAGGIAVGEGVFGEVPSVTVVHPRGDQGIKQRAIGEVVEDVVVTRAGIGQRGQQAGGRPGVPAHDADVRSQRCRAPDRPFPGMPAPRCGASRAAARPRRGCAGTPKDRPRGDGSPWVKDRWR